MKPVFIVTFESWDDENKRYTYTTSSVWEKKSEAENYVDSLNSQLPDTNLDSYFIEEFGLN